MGRLTFTQDEIDTIRSISDFSDGSEAFTRSDLDELILRGTVKVEG